MSSAPAGRRLGDVKQPEAERDEQEEQKPGLVERLKERLRAGDEEDDH